VGNARIRKKIILNKFGIKIDYLLKQNLRQHFKNNGFSMLEAVVVVGVLLALAIGGFLAYGQITENAKIAKVKSAASEVFTSAVVNQIDGDQATKVSDSINDYNDSTDKIKVKIGRPGDPPIDYDEPSDFNPKSTDQFCVTATWSEDSTINSTSGNCEAEETVVPPDEDADNSAILATYTCGPAEIKITQAMQDHSDANLLLKDAGKESEMIPYPGGGWNIIIDPASILGQKAKGAYFSTDGDSKMLNNLGYSMMIIMLDQCEAIKTNELGEVHSDNGIASVGSSSKGMWEESYYKNNIATRIDGPQYIRYDESHNVTARLFRINSNIIMTKENWIAAGGNPESWDTPIEK
jgi:type II secretory pathway pseudopilin PulG